jgi:hypothetical protein
VTPILRNACESEIYAEIKALAGGATSVVGSLLPIRRYALLSDDEAIATAHAIWERTNIANLKDNIVRRGHARR